MRARRLQVDAEIVEIDAALGRHAQQVAGVPVDARVGLAQAELARFDDMLEQRHDLGDGLRLLGLRAMPGLRLTSCCW